MTGETAEQLCEQLILSSLPGAMVAVSDGPGADLTVRLSAETIIAVHIKAMGAPRVDDLIGRLATGVLTLGEQAASPALAVAAVGMDRLGSRSVQSAQSFMRMYGRGVGWLLFDARGNYDIHLPGLLDETELGHVNRVAAPPAPRLFTDLNQWLLKVLLLAQAPPRCFPERFRSTPSNPSELATAAQVSHQTAYSFVHALEHHRMLQSGSGPRVASVDRLLADWLHVAQRRADGRIWARSAVGWTVDETLDIAAQMATPVAVGGFEACRRLGVLHASTAAIAELHVADTASALERLTLSRCEARDADVALIQPQHPQAVFRGVQRIDDVPVVDVIQAALDVVCHPARGREQAEFIAAQVKNWQAR